MNKKIEMTTEKKFINILFDIFGYSFVGILAYIFGLVLQNYNSEENYFFNSILSLNSEGYQTIFVIIIQVFLILIFGHAYATVVLYKEEYKNQKGDSDQEGENSPIDVCHTVGHWLETIFVCVFVFLVLIQILNPKLLSLSFWITILSIIAVYLLNFIVYRINVRKKGSFQKSSKYALICPALLMIGVNIYMGANMLSFLNGSIICFIPIAAFFIFYLLLYIINNEKIKIIYSIIILCTLIAGVISLIPSFSDSTKMIMKNLFLAIVVSIFLSIFESWYVAFRQLKDSENITYAKASSIIIVLMPPIVFLLFPVQDFNLIYFISFCGGMLYTEWMWFVKILPAISKREGFVKEQNSTGDEKEKGKVADEVKILNEDRKEKRRTAVSRAICGILTLIFLMLDKYFQVSIPVKKSQEGLFDLGNVLSIITILIAISEIIVTAALGIKKDGEKKLDFLKDYKDIMIIYKYMFGRLGAYCLAIFISYILYSYIDLDVNKKFLSAVAMLSFLLIENGYILYYKFFKQKNTVAERKSESERA